MKTKLPLSAACLCVCLGMTALPVAPAYAQQEMGSLVYYDVPAAEYAGHDSEWRHFLEYNLQREPCQKYVAPPAGYVMKGCHVYRVSAMTPVATTQVETTVTETRKVTASPAATASNYTVHFGFNQSNVPENEERTLDNVAQDIRKHNPATVTVSGYASTPGSAGYNQALSERRAAAVAQELTQRGVKASTIDQKAYGETHLAVSSPDNVKMPQNRRVVIEFNR